MYVGCVERPRRETHHDYLEIYAVVNRLAVYLQQLSRAFHSFLLSIDCKYTLLHTELFNRVMVRFAPRALNTPY